MFTNKKGLGIKTTQPFTECTHSYLTSKKLLTPLQNIDFYPYFYGVNFVNHTGRKL